MAEVTGFGLDLSSFIAQADKADRRIRDMVQHSAQLQANFHNIVEELKNSGSAGNILQRIERLSNTKVSPLFDNANAEKFEVTMDKIVRWVDLISSKGKLEIFDDKAIYDSSNNLLQNQQKLNAIREEIKRVKQEYKDTFKEFDKTFVPPINKITGSPFRENSQTYQNAKNVHDKTLAFREEEYLHQQKIKRAELELEMRYLVEIEAIAKKGLEWSKMTESEKTTYIEKELKKQLALQQKQADEIRKEYRKVLNDQLDIMRKTDNLSKKNIGSEGMPALQEYDRQFMEKNRIREELEQEYGFLLVDIAEDANRKILDIETTRIKNRQKAEEEAWIKYLSSPEGALDLAANAKTINQMKEAQKYLQEARGNVDISDSETIKKLNDEYTRLRMTIESLTTAEKNEHSLQPTLRNEYARLLVELDKVTDAKNRASKTNAFQLGDAKAQQDHAALLAREQDIREKMSQIEKAALPNAQERVKLEKEIADWTAERIRLGKLAGGKDIAEARKGGGSQTAKDYLYAEEQVKALQAKLANTERNESAIDEIVRRHEAMRAANSIAETEKTERANFEAERKRLLEIQELRRQTATRSTARANQIVDQSENVQNIAQEEQAVKRLEDARRRLNKNDADYEATLKRINDAIAQHTHNIKMATDASYREAQAKKQAQQQNTTYQGAMDYSKNVKSINDQIKAIEYLKQARANLDRASMSKSEYEKQIKALTLEIQRQQKEVDRLTGKSSNLKNGMGKLGTVVQQLKSQLTALFGVAAIKGYIQKLVDVRREFERQQKALEGILQSKDEADKLWSQTTQLALKSPFSVRELITYTKQLSAYRIETDKLHDTTKRLADVSAGLGVDMSRLILAYGQVRAAEYLRGTELRQFTEAGIPMLEELAKYFTELEGRTISTADVFEMISKRMVDFADVEAVIHRMTDEGGIFFEMQEKQSKTLYGELSNLKDAYELMLNSIGERNEGTIKRVIQTMRSFVENWKDVMAALQVFLPLFGLYKTTLLTHSKGLKKAANSTLWLNKALKAKIGTTLADIESLTWQEAKIMGVTKRQYALGKVTMYAQSAFKGLWAITKSAFPMLIIAGISYLYEEMTKATRKAEELKKALSEIVTADKTNLDKQLDSYKDLVARLGMVNKGSLEHSNIIQKLNSQYGEYLDFLVTEKTTIDELENSYEGLVEKMSAKIQLESYQKSLEEINNQSKEAITSATDDFKEQMKRGFKPEGEPFLLIPTNKEIDAIYSIIRQKVRETKTEQLDSYKEQAEFLNKIINKYYGKDLNPFTSTVLPALVDELIKVKKEEEKIQDEINAQYDKTYETQEQTIAFENLKNEYAEKRLKIEREATNEFKRQQDLQKLSDEEKIAILNKEVELGLRSKKSADEAIKAITDWMKPITQSINDSIRLNLSKLFSEEELSTVLINQELQKNKNIANYVAEIKKDWETTNQLILNEISLKSAGLKIDENELKELQKKEQLYRKTAEILGIELNYIQKMNEETRQAVNSMFDDNFSITLEDAWGGLDNVLKKLNDKANEQEKIIKQINKHKASGLPYDEQALKNAEDLYLWTKKRLNLLSPDVQKPIDEKRLSEINNRLEKEYQIDIINSQKTEVQLLSDANSEKEKAIAYEAQLLDMQKEGLTVTVDELTKAKKAVEQTTLKWDLLGGEEVVKEPKEKNIKKSIDEVVRIVKDTHDDYKKLAKTLDHAQSKQMALVKNTEAFAEAIKEIPSLAKFKLEDFAFDKEDGAIEMLEKLKSLIPATAKNYKSLMVDIEQAIGDIRGEAIIEAKVKADEDLANEIEEMFDGYELSLELDKLGLPKNFMSDLFHIDIFNLDQIRDKIEGEIDKIESGKGEKDNLKKLQDFLKKVDDMEEKQMQERLKKYSKYLLKSQSEAVKIKLEELRQLEEIESLSDVSNAQKSVMKQGVRDEAQKKLDKATWDTFKDSDMYIRMFEDLESQSTKSIQRMREELSKYRDSLKSLDDPTALKEIGSRIDALDEQIAKRNPFKGLSEAYKNYREVIKEYGSRNDLEDSLAINRDKERTLTKRVDDQQIKVDTERKALNDALLKGNVLEISARKQSLATEEETLDVMVKQLATQKGITEEEARKLLKLDNARKMFTGSLADIGADISNITSAFPTIMSDLESMGVSISDSTRDTVESVAEIGSGIGNAIQGIASGNIVQVITGVTSALAGIAKIGDKKKERQIQREIKLVEELGRQYEKLQDKIEKAYSLDTFRASYNATQANLEKQIEAYDRMIAAEEDKKNTDRERIKEWKQAQEDLRKQQQELRDQQLQELGGFGESGYKDAAQQFVDAWVDAFKETGDGLSGLEDKWDEYLQNIIRKQMALKISDKLVQPLLSELDKALENDSYLSTDEMKKITALSEELFPQISESLQKLAEMYGSDWLKTDGGLSGLTQGIQGITEQTADQLAGLVNSIRLYVANNNTELIRIASALGASTQVENPMVSQLKIIASHTNNISTILESVVTSSTLGRGIRVITEI